MSTTDTAGATTAVVSASDPHPKIRKRGGFFALVALGLLIIVGGSAVPANLTAKTIQENHKIGQNATFPGLVFKGDGLIDADVTPGAQVQTFPFEAVNEGSMPGKYVFTIEDGPELDVSDAAQDDTMVTLSFKASDNRDTAARMTLRQFLNNAFMPKLDGAHNFIAQPGKPVYASVTFEPVTNGANWTQEDLGKITAAFASSYTLVATDVNNHTNLDDYFPKHGVNVGNYYDVWMIPVADLPAAVGDDLAANVPAV